MKTNLPQDQSMDDFQLDDQAIQRRERIRMARQDGGSQEKFDTSIHAGATKTDTTVTIPIDTWSEVIRLARMGQQSLLKEASGKFFSVPTQQGEVICDSNSYRCESDADFYKHRSSATIAALRRRH